MFHVQFIGKLSVIEFSVRKFAYFMYRLFAVKWTSRTFPEVVFREPRCRVGSLFIFVIIGTATGWSCEGVPITTDPVRSKRPPQDAHNAGCNKDEKTPNKQRKVGHLCRMGDRSYNWWESERFRGEIFAKERISGFSRNSSFSGLKGGGGEGARKLFEEYGWVGRWSYFAIGIFISRYSQTLVEKNKEIVLNLISNFCRRYEEKLLSTMWL